MHAKKGGSTNMANRRQKREPMSSSKRVVVAFDIETVLEKIDGRLEKIEDKLDNEVEKIREDVSEIERKGSDTAQEAIRRATSLEDRMVKVERSMVTNEAVQDNSQKIEAAQRSAGANRVGLWVVGIVGVLQALATLAMLLKK